MIRRAFTMATVVLFGVTLWGQNAAAGVTESLTTEEMLVESGAVVYGTVSELDVRAGTDSDPATEVTFQIQEVIAGTIETDSIVFDIPEGQFVGTKKYFLASGTPKFLEGESYLVFYINDEWILSPVVGYKQGILHETTVDSTRYLTFMNGTCVRSIDQEWIQPGPPIASPVPFAGPVIDGEQRYFTPESFRELSGKTSSCLTKSEVMAELAEVIDELGYTNMESRLELTPSQDATTWDVAEVDGIPAEETTLCEGSGDDKECEEETPPEE